MCHRFYRGVRQLADYQAHNLEDGGSSPSPATKQNMKTLILESGTYKLFAEYKDCIPDTHKELVISSQLTDSKNPDEFQVQFRVTLNESERETLKNFL